MWAEASSGESEVTLWIMPSGSVMVNVRTGDVGNHFNVPPEHLPEIEEFRTSVKDAAERTVCRMALQATKPTKETF